METTAADTIFSTAAFSAMQNELAAMLESDRRSAEMTAYIHEGSRYLRSAVAPVGLETPMPDGEVITPEIMAAGLAAMHFWLPISSPLGLAHVVYTAMRRAATSAGSDSPENVP